MRAQSACLFDFYEPLPIRVERSDAPLTSDAGVLARVTNKGFYYDVADRLTASVDVGTNNGTA